MKYHLDFDIDLKRNPHPGKYIVLEGVDGSGKTTQVEKLRAHFEHMGKKVIAVREPRKEGLIGDIVQKALYGKVTLPAVAMQYLFSADRSMHHETVIEPALKVGTIVISDRCFWSAVVYGILDKTGGKYNKGEQDLNAFLIAQSILSMYHQFIVPDCTFYLKVTLQTALSRIEKEEKKKEIYEEEGKLAKIIEGYDWLVTKFPTEFVIVNGERPVKEVTEEIIGEIT